MPNEENVRGEIGYDSPMIALTDSGESKAKAESGWPVKNWDLYQVVSFIGDGGMHRVYKAYDPQLKRHDRQSAKLASDQAQKINPKLTTDEL